MLKALRLLKPPAARTVWDVAPLPFVARRLEMGEIRTAHDEAVAFAFSPPREAVSGDLLELGDGRLVEILSAEEPLLELSGAAALKAAHEAGRRGWPIALEGERALLPDSPQTRAMFGAEARPISEPFEPHHRPLRAAMAPYVAALARGPSKGRSLTQDEARDAMRLILSEQAAPEATGALLMLLRYKSETAAETAGLVQAMRESLDPRWRALKADVDWPCYAAGASRGAPLFLLSAKLLARAGLRVLVHGWSPDLPGKLRPESAAPECGIPILDGPQAFEGVAFAPLEALNPRFLEVLRLREVLGLRSPVNSCLRALNPTEAATSLQGVFHPPYRDLQRDAAALLGQPRFMALKGGGGEFERHPAKAIELYGLAAGAPVDLVAPPIWSDKRRLADETPVDPGALWRGEAADDFAAAVVIGTAAAALLAAGASPDLGAAEARAARLWAERGA